MGKTQHINLINYYSFANNMPSNRIFIFIFIFICRDHNNISPYGFFSTRWFRQPVLQINTFLREKSNLLMFHKEVASCYNGK